MSSSAPSKFECSKCKIFKNVKEYTLDKYKQPYPRCKLCFNADNIEYWSKQQFKVCGTCKVDKPLRKFNNWNNVPHRNCQNCWEAEYVKKRADAREKAAGQNGMVYLVNASDSPQYYHLRRISCEQCLKKLSRTNPISESAFVRMTKGCSMNVGTNHCQYARRKTH